MTLSDDIRAKMATATPDAREFGDWVLAQLSLRGRKAAAGRTSESMRRGGKTKAARSAYMRALALKRYNNPGKCPKCGGPRVSGVGPFHKPTCPDFEPPRLGPNSGQSAVPSLWEGGISQNRKKPLTRFRHND